jgi:pyruvate/2-oxoglutarate dehydrogenase complex dihydrolipoamide dehydrogenase (E3) component
MLFEPDTKANRLLKSHVAPDDRTNPEPAEMYNLVVIGAGPCGLIAAAGAAGLGGKVALIERHAMGGDCLNVGCVPSKGLIRAARAAAQVKRAAKFGVITAEPDMDFATAMNRMRKIRADISRVDGVNRYQEELGVDVFLGDGSFASTNTIEVSGSTLHFKKALIATGARAARIPIPGLWEAGAHTNETIFSLTELPPRLAVIGAGPIGCELSQSFARFGSAVSLFDQADHILIREDADAAAIVQKSMTADDLEILCNSTIKAVTIEGEEKCIHYEIEGKNLELRVDAILVAVGRTPNIEGLNLESAGVRAHPRGIEVDDRLRTANKNIFAAGDVAMKHQFTHTADAAARIVIQNALFHGRKKLSALTIPWCTYTEPEIAHVGMGKNDARDQGIEIDTYVQALDHVDRAMLDGETDGFVKVHTRKGTAEILGATMVASHAGDMISELTLAITHGIGLDKIASTIHPYPTQAEAIKKVADSYSRTKLTPLVSKLFKKWLKWSRR